MWRSICYHCRTHQALHDLQFETVLPKKTYLYSETLLTFTWIFSKDVITLEISYARLVHAQNDYLHLYHSISITNTLMNLQMPETCQIDYCVIAKNVRNILKLFAYQRRGRGVTSSNHLTWQSLCCSTFFQCFQELHCFSTFYEQSFGDHLRTNK
jgi:hypothetical protein